MSRRNGTPRHPTAKLKGGWSPEEDALLTSLVKQFGEGHWSPIARALNEALNKSESTGRIGKQCRERWNHHLSPGLRKGPWTPEEEAMVVDAHKRFGNRWSDIARCISGRSENAVKNHWNATLRKRVTLDNPAGPLKEYLDTLKLTVTPRRRNGGSGAGGASAAGGFKRQRGTRDHGDSTSDESGCDNDEDEDVDSPPDSVTTTPSRGRASRGSGAAISTVKRSAGCGAAVIPRPFAAIAGVVASESACALGAPFKASRTPSEGGVPASVSATALRCTAQHDENNEAAPSGAAVTAAARCRRSKRVAAKVGNERLRYLAESEEREAVEAADTEVLYLSEPVNGRTAGSTEMEDSDGNGDAESMRMHVEVAAMVAAGQASSARKRPAAELGTPLDTVGCRYSRAESICESGECQASAPQSAPSVATPRRSAAATTCEGPEPPMARDVQGLLFGRCCALEHASMPGSCLSGSTLGPVSTAVTSTLGLAVAVELPGNAGLADSLAAPSLPPPAFDAERASKHVAVCQPELHCPCGRSSGTGPDSMWPTLANNWSTNNMQMLQSDPPSPCALNGMCVGAGKVRPAAGGGGGKQRSLESGKGAAAGSATGLVSRPAITAPLLDASASAFASLPCIEYEDLLLDTIADYAGSQCDRHVTSGTALYDYTGPPGADVTAVPAPPLSLNIAAAAMVARPPPAEAPSTFLPQPWSSRMPSLAPPGRSWTPPDFNESHMHLEFGSPDSPLHHEVAVPLTESVVAAMVGRCSGAVGSECQAGPDLGPDVGFGHVHNDTARMYDMEVVAAAMQPAGMATMGCGVTGMFGHVGVGVVGGGGGVTTNSSITSVGSPLSELYEYGDGAVRVGDVGKARKQVGSGGTAAPFGDADGPMAASGSLAPGLALKRESSFSGSGLPGVQGVNSSHPMAPFRPVSCPRQVSAAPGTQPTSPWQPLGLSATVATPLYTMPTAPASPISWSVPLTSGQAAAATVSMSVPYVYGGSALAPQVPQVPALTSAGALSTPPPPYFCYGMQSLPPHAHGASSAGLAQMQLAAQSMYGASAAHPVHLQYPHAYLPQPYTVVHAVAPGGAAHMLTVPPSVHQGQVLHSAQQQQQPQGQQQTLSTTESLLRCQSALPQYHHQQQQHSITAVEPTILYLGPGFYFCSPTPYMLYGTMPYCPAPGQLPSVSMPLSMPASVPLGALDQQHLSLHQTPATMVPMPLTTPLSMTQQSLCLHDLHHQQHKLVERTCSPFSPTAAKVVDTGTTAATVASMDDTVSEHLTVSDVEVL